MALALGPTGSGAFDGLFRRSSTNVPAGQQLAAQGDRADIVIRLVRGHLRSCIYTECGHRQIVSFARPGAILGLGSSASSVWNVTVETVTDAVIETAPRRLAEVAVEADRAARRELVAGLRAEVAARDAHLVLMSVFPATERVEAFLKEFRKERGHDGFIALPMCRKDIADYLGLSQETVSRAFTALREAGKIELHGAGKFRICDPDPALRQRAA